MGNLIRRYRQFRRYVKIVGLWNMILIQLEYYWVDFWYGVETRKTEKKYSNGRVFPYSPVIGRFLRDIVKSLPTRTKTFVDLGCGKGSALIQANRLGFDCMVGVELIPQLVDICRENMYKAKIFADIITGDMADLRSYPGITYFLCNPCGEKTIKDVADNIAGTGSYVIYFDAYFRDVFDDHISYRAVWNDTIRKFDGMGFYRSIRVYYTGRVK